MMRLHGGHLNLAQSGHYNLASTLAVRGTDVMVNSKIMWIGEYKKPPTLPGWFLFYHT